MTRPLRAAVLQLSSTPDRARNLTRTLELVNEAAAAGAELILTPENTDQIAPRDVRLAAAEPLEGPFVSALRDRARRLGRWLLIGSFAERIAASARVHNTSVLIDPRGEVAAVYRKIHLFDADLPDGTSQRESEAVEPGRDVVTADTPAGKLGLTVCYDLRFPELYRLLAARGATLFAVPSAFTEPTGRAHWEVLLRARAIENLGYVLAPAQVGEHFPGRRSYGHALVVDPWGRVLADAGEASDGFVLATLDPAVVERSRAMLPALSHGRLPGGVSS